MVVFWRAMVVGLLSLPVAAYVTGTLAGPGPGLPTDRPAIVLDADEARRPPDLPAGRPDPGLAQREGAAEAGAAGPDGVRVVVPQPEELDREGAEEGGREHRDGTGEVGETEEVDREDPEDDGDDEAEEDDGVDEAQEDDEDGADPEESEVEDSDAERAEYDGHEGDDD